MKAYGLKAVEALIEKYVEYDGEILTVQEGTLGYGLTICYGHGLKTAVITERYINEWTSAHTVRMYDKMPEKYRRLIMDYYNAIDED